MNWTCTYFEAEPDLYELATDDRLVMLAHWSFDKHRSVGWLAWLQHTFVLEPTDFCVRYFLFIDCAPQETRIYINGQEIAGYRIGDDDAPYEYDITEYVTLGKNSLAFRVDCEAEGGFNGVSLQPYPCDVL